MADFRKKRDWIISSTIIQTLLSIGNDDDLAILVRAYFNYLLTGEQNPLPNELALFFNFLVADTDAKEEAYAAMCEQKSEAGKKGMASRWHNDSK